MLMPYWEMRQKGLSMTVTVLQNNSPVLSSIVEDIQQVNRDTILLKKCSVMEPMLGEMLVIIIHMNGVQKKKRNHLDLKLCGLY